MAKLISTSGQTSIVKPKNGKNFQLKEIYKLIDCETIEIVYLKKTNEMIVLDEEGKLYGKEVNEVGSEIAHKNQAIQPYDYIVGTILIVNEKELE